jgi:hypothetical protein
MKTLKRVIIKFEKKHPHDAIRDELFQKLGKKLASVGIGGNELEVTLREEEMVTATDEVDIEKILKKYGYSKKEKKTTEREG